MIDTVSQSSGAGAASAAQTASRNLDGQYQQFLTLLTAQISNQDPLKPMDATQFVSQLAQLTQVEQGVATNRNLEMVLTKLSDAAATSDMQMIGRDVLVPGNSATLDSDGFAGGYYLDRDASSVKVDIRDRDGSLITSFDADGLSAGQAHTIDWDGRDSLGLPVPPDVLRFDITALDADGAEIGGTQLTKARVESLTFTSSGPELQLDNGDSVLSIAVRSVL